MADASRIVPTGQNPDLVSSTILIEGKELSKTHQVVGVIITLGINKIPAATMVVIDGEPNKETFDVSNSGDFLPGKRIEIKLGYHNNNTTVFKGIIITNTHKINDNCAELTVECKDETVKMTMNKGNHHFSKTLDSEVVEQLLRDNKIANYEVAASKVSHEQLMQSNISDWDYMVSRLDVNGMICVAGNGKVTVKIPDLNADAKLSLTYGADIMDFHADMDARTQSTSVKTYTWDFENQKVKIVDSDDSKAPEEGAFTRSDLAAVNDQPTEMRTSATLTQDEAQAIANAKKLRQDLSKIKAKIKYQGTQLAGPGDFIMLNGVGKNFNGKAFVSAVQHEYNDGDWVTEATLGWDEKFFTEDTNPSHASSATGQASSLQGLQIGVVTSIVDDGGQYRVKMRLPLVNEKDEGIFARVATLDAGKGRGTFFRPEVEDEVLIGFVNDDPKSPVILGMLHSSAKPAPLEPEDKNPEKGYVSRSGIRLIFNDDKKGITITTPGKRTFAMNDDDGSITVSDDDGNKLVMDSSGIIINSASDLTIKAGNSISISAPQVSVSADLSLSLEGSGSTSVNSSGVTEVKGSIVKIN